MLSLASYYEELVSLFAIFHSHIQAFEEYLKEEHNHMQFHQSVGRLVRFCRSGRAVFCMRNEGGFEVEAEEGIEEVHMPMCTLQNCSRLWPCATHPIA